MKTQWMTRGKLFNKLFLAKILLSLLFFSPAFKSGNEHPDLKTAVKNHLISYTLTGNIKSSHYQKPVLLTLQNLRKANVTIGIDNGMELRANDSSYQNMVITKSELICLKPLEKKTIELYGMCTEPSDRAPDAKTIYMPANMASAGLKEVTGLIQESGYFDIAGQSAVWAVINKRDIEDISGFDTTETRKLQMLVSQISGKPMPPPPAKNDYLHNYQCREYVASIGGSFEFASSKKMSVVVAMFDKNNIVVRELYKNTDVAPGTHKFNYEFDATVYRDDYYYIRFIADEQIRLSRKVSMKI
jgi:hypothetical protein